MIDSSPTSGRARRRAGLARSESFFISDLLVINVNFQGCMLIAVGAQVAASSMVLTADSGTGLSSKLRTARLDLIASKIRFAAINITIQASFDALFSRFSFADRGGLVCLGFCDDYRQFAVDFVNLELLVYDLVELVRSVSFHPSNNVVYAPEVKRFLHPFDAFYFLQNFPFRTDFRV
jgi:hypothetical protein